MIDTHRYPVCVRWSTGKQGAAEIGSLPPLQVASPPEFGGPEGHWTPEHLFVASVASCLMTTFTAIAENSKLSFEELDVPAEGTLERGTDRRFRITEVTLRPRLVLSREADEARALRILEKAHQACLISNSIQSEVQMKPLVEVAAPAH